ncbi:MAG: DUF1729 domain-containing protein [Corynebacterium sp.]|nr:DUF1729 domain-containing protein [Corynebacterium sp.]
MSTHSDQITVPENVTRPVSEPYALAFAGQGFAWLPTLKEQVVGPIHESLAGVIDEAASLIAPLEDAIAGTRPFGFAPLEWAKTVGTDADTIPAAHAAVSVPGIFLAQLATLESLKAQGLDIAAAKAVIGHSQGALGVAAVEHADKAASVLAIAQLIGAALTRTARGVGLIAAGEATPMLAVRGATREQLEAAIARVSGADLVLGLKNTRDNYVVVGKPAELEQLRTVLEAMSAKSAKELEAKLRGGAAFVPKSEYLDVDVAFHHPALQPAVEQVASWATELNLDVELARGLAQTIIIDPVNWPSAVASAAETGAAWILDLGPAAGVSKLTEANVAGRGIGVIAAATLDGQDALFDAGKAPARPRPWSDFAPQLVRENGQVRLSTAFTRLTGRSPMMLPGMTPTTVDPEIVAAAANGGHWAEMAGGGQVTPEIFQANLDKLKGLLKPGVNVQFNSMFLDPYLWKLHVGATKLVPKARANGAPIDGLVVTAGMPDQDEALALIESLRAGGFSWVSFKPGAVKHIHKVLNVARAVPDFTIIMQVEGGKAGGHHSWEDLDELLIAAYDDIRQTSNVVLCVGGGIATPEQAADYIDGSWATKYELPAMPVDAILLGTVAMATKEAKTSASVKKLLVETAGTHNWVGAGHAIDGMASGRSQLGADIHEIDNSAAKAGRLLDEVAGDEEAVAARREEIIAAIAKTAKPYFGDLESMSYQAWLERYLELSGPFKGEWTDPSWLKRYEEMVARVEARLNPQDHGTLELAVSVDADNPAAAIAQLGALYDLSQVLHPADREWFLKLARIPGKPVNFVPVIDKDVRRWWRSDSLWQAHDERYDADQVCIIPGISAVAGITKADEPVAELLDRFNASSIDRLEAAGAEVREGATALEQIIAAPGMNWAGRDVQNILHRIAPASEWVIDGESATCADATITMSGTTAKVTVDLGANARVAGKDAVLEFSIQAPEIPGQSPLIAAADADAAMSALTVLAAGGQLAEGTLKTSFNGSLAADYSAVTAGMLGADLVPSGLAPDVLVGYAWPAIFAAVKNSGVVEGMLDLVHLEHQIELDAALPEPGTELSIAAKTEAVADTDLGRVILVTATIEAEGTSLARLTERFAIRGRAGQEPMPQAGEQLATTVTDTPRSFRTQTHLRAPENMRAFAITSGDRNPIHVSDVAARMAGLGAPIVHGMWTSAIAQLVAAAATEGQPGREIRDYHAQMLAPIALGAELDVTVVRKGVDSRAGYGEVREITVSANGETALIATATVRAPRTFYAFPGQGIQSQGMGMDAYASSAAARDVWDRADRHTRTKLGFSIVEIVRNNPTEVVVDGERFYHPKGVLFLTQFTQVGMATLGVAQIAQMREANALEDSAFFAGHSVGEYNALAAYAQTLSLEGVVEIVYRRGLTMHRLVERDENGESNYGLAALRPNKMGLTKDTVADFVAELSAQTGEFLEIVNYNIAGVQYAVAGTTKGLKALAAAAEEKAPGQRAFIQIPGIDVPFHSSHLRDGVADFREHLDRLLPATVDLDVLVGRYIPNLVARPFEVTADFVADMLKVAQHPIIEGLHSQLTAHESGQQLLDAPSINKVARTMLVELLAWQFASPVRWIETQDLALTTLGIERFVEVGVGSAPTVANMFGQTLRLPQYQAFHPEALNVERDAAVVFATDSVPVPAAEAAVTEESVDEAAPAAPAAATPEPVAAAPAAPAASGPVSDIVFTPADATEMLIAQWTKVRPDQMSTTDTIEALVEGVSSRRNQLLLDLGVEFGLGAIDGAADAELADLKKTVAGMAKSYTAFGPVLAEASADALRRITGPAGKKPAYVAERVSGTWGLGQGWVDHVTAAVVLGTREGSSLRGGDLATLTGSLDDVIDAAVQQVAAAQGVSVAMPGSGSAGTGGVVDSAALNEFAEKVTGENGVLAETARGILRSLGLEKELPLPEAPDTELYDTVTRELGSDWPRQVAPSFSAAKALQLDDRWASAREDLARVIAGQISESAVNVYGAGEAVAKQAEFFAAKYPEFAVAMRGFAAKARKTEALDFATDIAVVTGASPRSIAAAVVAQLLRGGATVIATTSRLDHTRTEFYKSLYRENARGGAALWVVPANLSSYTDVDALVEWIGNEETATVNGASKLVKPAQVPTLLFPFAAPRVQGTLADAGAQAENQMRLLLWSVERLIAGLGQIGTNTHVGQRLHVVLPGSPNRGRFGGDGAYGESKAALDALVQRWNAEPVWADNTSIVHTLIGWVRGTGLMGGNDPLVDAVEAAGVTTFSTEEIAAKLIDCASAETRATAAQAPITKDYTGGLGQAELNLAELARNARAEMEAANAASNSGEGNVRVVDALPNIPARKVGAAPEFSGISQKLEDMVVIVGTGELGPYGSSRTRFEAELDGDLSAAGVVELAWSMGLISYENGWVDADGNELDEAEIYSRFHDEVMARVGVRRYNDDFDMVDNLAPELTTIYLDKDMEFAVADEATARTFLESEPDNTVIAFVEGEWKVTRKAGSAIRVPRRVAMSRFVGGQIPQGFDPTVYGIPADMADNLDRVALWNLVCTVDAFLASGFTPAELLHHLHPARISSTQGTGMGAMESLRSLYLDRILAEPRANDILQEALPNVVAAHVMQSYVGGYGQMIHPVGACATAAVSVEEGMDKIRLGKSDFVVAGGIDDLSVEGITGFGDMAATADSAELAAKGIEDRFFSRANDRRRAGFIESNGGGTILLARGSVAADLGLPVLGVLGYAQSFADGAHTSIPAPGLGALAAACGGEHSGLATSLRALDVSADEISILSKHDTSTNANDPNESELHESIAEALGRSEGNPLYVISQKTLTGHAKGGAAAFQIIGLTQVLAAGELPANRSLDCVDPVLAKNEHLVWLRDRLVHSSKAGFVTSLGFGHVSALVAVVHPEAFYVAVEEQRGADLRESADARITAGSRRILDGIYGGAALYERPVDRNLGKNAKAKEKKILVDPEARIF